MVLQAPILTRIGATGMVREENIHGPGRQYWGLVSPGRGKTQVGLPNRPPPLMRASDKQPQPLSKLCGRLARGSRESESPAKMRRKRPLGRHTHCGGASWACLAVAPFRTSIQAGRP